MFKFRPAEIFVEFFFVLSFAQEILGDDPDDENGVIGTVKLAKIYSGLYYSIREFQPVGTSFPVIDAAQQGKESTVQLKAFFEQGNKILHFLSYPPFTEMSYFLRFELECEIDLRGIQQHCRGECRRQTELRTADGSEFISNEVTGSSFWCDRRCKFCSCLFVTHYYFFIGRIYIGI